MKLRFIVSGLFFVFSGTMHAQVGVAVKIGTPPAWGPAEGGSRYYYIPDIHVYYDVNTANYIYLSNGVWIRSTRVPYAYRNYDFYGAYKVMLKDYHGDRPYDHYYEHRKLYPIGYHHGIEQKTYGERPHKEIEHHDNDHHDEHHDHDGK